MRVKEPDLDKIVNDLYGPRLKKYKNIKTAYSIFTAFKDSNTDKILYFYLLKTSTKNHLSDGSIEYALKKYNPFLSKVEFLQIDKSFEWAYYLVRTDQYLISLDELITLQKECLQIMDKDYMLKTIKFLIEIYKSKKCSMFPQLTPKSIGINEQGHLRICDYQFYFKKQFEMRSLTQNICSCINPMIKISVFKSSPKVLTLQNQFERLRQDYGENFAKLIQTLVLNPMDNMEKEGVINGQGKSVSIQKIEQALQDYYKTVEEDGNVTLNETFQEVQSHEDTQKKFIQSDLITRDSIKQPFLFSDESKKLKRKQTIKCGAIIMMILLVVLGAFLFLFYYSRQTNCDVGTFKPNGSNQCISCSEGCLRCDSEQKTACFSCSGKMYLVLINQNDTMGSCETTCAGTVLKSNLCLKSKNPNKKIDQQLHLTQN